MIANKIEKTFAKVLAESAATVEELNKLPIVRASQGAIRNFPLLFVRCDANEQHEVLDDIYRSQVTIGLEAVVKLIGTTDNKASAQEWLDSAESKISELTATWANDQSMFATIANNNLIFVIDILQDSSLIERDEEIISFQTVLNCTIQQLPN